MSVAARLRDAEDWQLVALLFVAVYLAYAILGVTLNYGLRGQINSLAVLTFWVAVFAMLSLALNLHWGYTGLFNIGVVAFMAIGAYTFAVLVKAPKAADPTASVGGFGLPIWAGVVGGILMAMVFGFIIALPALRLRADYLAIVTIAFSEIMRFTFLSGELENFTILGTYTGLGGGTGLIINPISNGVANIGPVEWIFRSLFLWGAYADFVDWVGRSFEITNPLAIMNNVVYGVVLLLVVGLFYWMLRRTGESPFGRVLKAIREDEDVARALGKNTDWFKIQSFMLGCALMGVVGILWFYNQGTVTPANVRPRITFYVWIALIIGGAGSNTGSVMGGALFAAVLFQGPRYVKNVIRGGVDTATIPNNFGQAVGPLVTNLDPGPFGLYLLGSINELQIVFMGVVLIWLMQNRPDGLLGHRKEEAAAIDLRRPQHPGAPRLSDGGEDRE